MRWFLLTAAGSALWEHGAASVLTPPVVPLTVRNPYLSTWLGDARITPWNKWPMFWTGEEVSPSGRVTFRALATSWEGRLETNRVLT